MTQPPWVEDVVEQEVGHVGEEGAAVEQREDLALVPLHQPAVRLLVAVGAAVLHAVLLGEALDLAVAEHRQAGHRRQQRADAEVLVALAELVDGRPLVRVVHEVDEALQHLGVELDRVLDDPPVPGVLLVAEHVHEGAVVDAVHAEGPDEVALHQPEGLGQQQRVGRLRRDAVHDLAPELRRHALVEDALGYGVLGPRRDVAALPGLGIPEPLDVASGQGHGRVEADDGELAGHVEDRPDDGLAHLRLEVVELGGVVPGHARAVVAVVDVADVARSGCRCA